MKVTLVVAVAVAALGLPTLSHAVELDYIGARAGTLGVGGEVAMEVNPLLTIRGVAQGASFSYDDTQDDIAYTGDFKLGSVGVLADIHLAPGLYATAGIFSNSNKLELTATPTGPTEIGGETYTAAEVGTLKEQTTFKDMVPYFGLGWRAGIGPAEFNIEGGAYLQGSPKVALSANGTLSGNAAFKDDLAQEAASIEDDLEDLKVYPALSVALRMKF